VAPDAPLAGPAVVSPVPQTQPDVVVPLTDEADRGSGPPSGRRVRARLARLTATKPGATPPVLEPLNRSIRASHPKADLRLVQRAYEVAEQMHGEQRRRSHARRREQLPAVTRVFATHHVGRGERGGGARRKVAQIPDWGGDHHEAARPHRICQRSSS